MAASNQHVTPREVSISASIEINSIEAERHILNLPSSVTANTDEVNNGDLSPINACPQPIYPNISISDNSNNDHSNDDNSDNSPYPQTPSKSKSKSHSLSFSYEASQIGKFYMQQQAAKKSNQYQSYPKTSMDEYKEMDDNESDDDDDDEKDDKIMDKILINRMLIIYQVNIHQYTLYPLNIT